MPRQQIKIEIGNLVIKFGDKYNLVDLLSEVVYPAFFDNSLRRTYSETTYLVYEPEALNVGGEAIIVGRLVKDTILEREQLLVSGELKEASGELPSSPSSLFGLMLGCHRLLYVRQHKGSPSLDVFRSTIARFLTLRHRAFLKALSMVEDPSTQEKPSLKSLVENFPYPTVELTPLGSNDSIHAFIAKFKTIETVTARLIPTNSELDNDGLFKALRASQTRMDSRRTSVHYENKKKGLDSKEAEDQLTALSKQGNHAVTVTGVNQEGEKIEGNNDNFKVKIPISGLPDDQRVAAKTLVDRFNSLKENEIITVPVSNPLAMAKLKAITNLPVV